MTNAETIARRFHEAYERLAPSFGYETRAETRHFDPASDNGRLMIAVCAELSGSLAKPAPVVTDEMVERALDEMFRFDGNLRNAVFIATGQSAACDAAARAWNNVYDVETHGDGSRTDNRDESMRAALTAALTPRDDAGEG